MLLRLSTHASFRRVFKLDMTHKLKRYFNEIVKPPKGFAQQTNTIISISGQTGSGKSLLTMTLGIQHFPNFTHKNMFFYDQQILEHAEDFPEGTLLVRDENPAKGIYGVGSMRIRTEVNVLAETCRKSGLSLAFIEPAFNPMEIVKLYIETVDMDIDQRISRVALMDATTQKYMGAAFIKVLPEKHPEWVAYNRFKDKFIYGIKVRNMADGKEDFDRMAEHILKELDTELYRNKKERKVYIIQKFPRLTNSEVDVLNTVVDVKLRGI